MGAVQHSEPLHMATRTLNHIYVVDRIFRAHLLGEAHGYTQTNTDDTPALGDLHFAAAETDHWFEAYVAGLSESALAESLNFQFTDGDAGRMTREEMLFHVLAHGSYHRGNVGQVLKGIGMVKPPRIPEPLRSRGWGILSHDIRPAELTPMLHGVGGGCSDGASPQSCL